MISNIVMMAVRDAEDAVELALVRDPGLDLDGRLRAAFSATRHHWLCTNEDERFKAGVGGVLLKATHAEQERINAELRNLQLVSAAVDGIPVNFDGIDTEHEPIGLLRIWREGGA